MNARERNLLQVALLEAEVIRAIVADCRAGLCPVELDDAPPHIEKLIAAMHAIADDEPY